MIDFVVGAIVVVIVGLALAYIIRSKKKGECVGCPYAKSCSSCSHTKEKSSACGCGNHACSESHNGHTDAT